MYSTELRFSDDGKFVHISVMNDRQRWIQNSFSVAEMIGLANAQDSNVPASVEEDLVADLKPVRSTSVAVMNIPDLISICGSRVTRFQDLSHSGNHFLSS